MLENDKAEFVLSDVDVESLLEFTPGYIYWKNLDSIYLGCNQNFAHLLGLESNKDIVGRSEYEMPWATTKPETAAHNVAADQQVISTGNMIVTEEDVDIKKPNELSTILRSEKRQLRNKKGIVIGVLGVSIDITDQKEAERLRLESERQQIALQEQEKFAQLARKVAHDINSPLASLKMLLPMCSELQEEKRTLLNRATEGIFDIANNLLSNYRKHNSDTSDIEARQHLLVSDLLIQLLSEKKMQYRNRPVTLETVIADDAHFAFIRMQPTEFRRSMSNLINNAVDALEDNTNSKVTVQLTVDNNAVVIEIQDNGKGMTAAMIAKMQNRQSFTAGKKNGHGLGLQQVWDTLEHNHGIMEVQSVLGRGTSIQLTFPRIAASNWIAQDIHLIPDNIIVVLDDDESIHTAWNLRFTPLLTSYPSLQIKHFTQGQEALSFLARLSQTQKDLVIFLSDYELLQQSKNGLEVVKDSGIKRAMLVTSYYSKSKIREETDRLGIKILPKQMASIIPILFANENVVKNHADKLAMIPSSKPLEPEESIPVPLKPFLDGKPVVQKTHLILLDDDHVFADAIAFRLSAHKKVVTHYPDPTVFLNECEKYAKDTPICIDNNFGLGADVNGTQVAERLHALEFTRLFLVSGDHFAPGAFPEYLTFLRKPEDVDLLDTL